MDYVYFLLGFFILLFAISDLAYTTYSPFGAGKIANFITKGCWNTSLEICGNDGSKKILQVVGIFAIGLVIIVWFLLIWLGGSLIFCSDEYSIIHSQTGRPASIAEKFYFTGFTLSTLGVGDFVPYTDGWRIFSVVFALGGFMLITTAISYMLPVLSADVFRKSIGRYITNLGSTPQEILKNHWQDGNFKSLEPHLTELMKMIILHNQQLLAYPILYCFHESDHVKSTAINLAKLDEALSILLVQVPEGDRPNRRLVIPLRKAITDYLLTQKEHFISYEDKEAGYSIPELGGLREAGIPLFPREDEVQDKYGKIKNRRRLIGSILRNEGWKIEDVYSERPPDDSDWRVDIDDV
ncbi:hypothetical protein BH24BAC1_BH24BAC1_11140 [soil metagenome]